ncbi:MAG: hypothetical protein VKN83_03890 [Cyanobacteriota bacterium]|nr:hypothetical protein [Cyanobacteriota bacterium]
MTRSQTSISGPSALDTFDRLRERFADGLRETQLRRLAFALLATGAGLAPLMAGSAQAAFSKIPTDGADTLLMPVLFSYGFVTLAT